MADVFLAKRVQDMVLEEQEPPPLYLCRKDKADSSALAQIPTIDLSHLITSPSTTVDAEELQRLKSALSSWGCFQAKGHGIPSSFLDQLREVTRTFFKLPNEEKMKYAKGVADVEGYGGDPVPAEGQPLDWQDRLFLDAYPEHRRNLQFWPENPPSFREILEEYIEKIRLVSRAVSKAIARCLDLEEDCFIKEFGKKAFYQARFNYYSPSHRPDEVMGLKAHADGSGYTLILQDEVKGLQVLKDGAWLTVPSNPQAILMLMGDQMEIMTNGIFKSPVHRVLTNSEKERISLAMFYTPEPGKEIGPVDGLVDQQSKPRFYKEVTNYIDIHWGYYQKGERAIHVAQL